MFIIVDEDFRIDVAGAKLGERQKEYLSVHYYDISAKLMELYGMSSDEIEVHLKKLKAERNLDVEDFLREFKPKYKGLIYNFWSYVKLYHLKVGYDQYPEKFLKESWEEFYTGGSWNGKSFCHFGPEQYLYIIGKKDVVDPKEWSEFVDHNIGYYLSSGTGPKYYDLEALDKAFEKFESSLGKVEESIENKLAENFANELKNLKKEGLFENIESFDLSLKNNRLNIKLNENEDESTYRWGANFEHTIDDIRDELIENPDYIPVPDKLFKTEEEAQEACYEYMDSDPTSFCEVLYLDKNGKWQSDYGYDGAYGEWSD